MLHVIMEAIRYAMEKAGFTQLKEKQEECIKNFIEGRDIFSILPTGYGKSLIYGLLPETFNHLRDTNDSIVVCVSPLTALVIDQKKKFLKRGIRAEYVGEAQCNEDAISNIINGQVQLVLISPESLLDNPRFRMMLQSKVYKKNLVAVVIDEAHCIKSWGERFRVAFAELGTLRSIIPASVNIMALTATCSTSTLDVIVKCLSLKDPLIIGISSNRANIFYQVDQYLPLVDFSRKLSSELSEIIYSPKTVIFCQSFRDCHQLYASLQNILKDKFTQPHGYPDMHPFRRVEMYHGGCMTYVRENVISSFTQERSTVRVVIATSSFGMGIDCPDIERVFHWGTPEDIEQYVQESGRAGRDGKPSQAILLPKTRHPVSDHMKQYVTNTTICRRKLLLESFMFNDNVQCPSQAQCCDICKHAVPAHE